MKYVFRALIVALLLGIVGIVSACAEDSEAVLVKPARMYAGPGTGEKQLASLSEGEECVILEEYNDEWVLVAAGGKSGYVTASALSEGIALPSGEEKPVFTLTGFDVPGYMDRTSGRVPVTGGVIASSLPMTRVRMYLYDDRLMREGMGVYQDFEVPVTEFDAAELAQAFSLGGLPSGEKRLVVEAWGEFGRVTAAEYEFYIRGRFSPEISLTAACTFRSSHTSAGNRAADNSLSSYWRAEKDGEYLTVTLPEGKTACSFTMKWGQPPVNVTVVQLDGEGNVLSSELIENPDGEFNFYRTIQEGARAIEIHPSRPEDKLYELDVYEAGREPVTVQKWEPMPEDVDLMIVVAHKNDETLYFSGVIPLYVAEGKKVGVVVMTEHADCLGQQELFDCLWLLGVKYHPIVMHKWDVKEMEFWRCANAWGGYDEVSAELVEIFRRYTPEVVITHGFRGEYGHVNHKLAASFTVTAAERAADASFAPESAERYGTWDVPKVYVHMYDDAIRVNLPFDAPMECFGWRTPMEMAYAAFDKYQTQVHNATYSLDVDGVRYDKTFFGLFRSNVGPDEAGTSLFEHID